MATFPAIKPRTRSLSLGDIPQDQYLAVSGGEIRFKNGSDFLDQVLTIGFEFLSESETAQIIQHYADQQGSLIPFDLPSEIWGGYSSPPVSSVDYQWRYAGPFDVNIAAPSQYNVVIELQTVPI